MSVNRYSESDRFKELQNRFRAILDSDERIPMFNAYGTFIYNFWQTAENPKGLWRRTTLEEYQKDDPTWEILIDFDELAKQEDKDWVYAGHEMLRPTNDRALVFLSKGGGDAIEIREFDTCENTFVKDGFFVPKAKSKVTWASRDRYCSNDIGSDLAYRFSYRDRTKFASNPLYR